MDENEQNVSIPNWWVEYIDDYNIKHLTPVQDINSLQYLQNNYYATIVRYKEA